MLEVDKQFGLLESWVENILNIYEDLDKVKFIEYYLNKNKEGLQVFENLQKIELSDGKSIELGGIDIIFSSFFFQVGNFLIEGNKELDKIYVKEREFFLVKLNFFIEENVIKEVLDFFLEFILDNSC